MCKVHDKVCGQDAIELFAEARILGKVCEKRYAYLTRQAKSFHSWLGGQPWCEDATVFCQDIVRKIEILLDPDADKIAEYLFQQPISKGELMALDFEVEYGEELERITDKGFQKAFSKAERLKGLELLLEKRKEELKLHDKIQDHLDRVGDRKHVGQYQKIFERIDTLKIAGQLSYGGWLLFNNQLLESIGRAPYAARYSVPDLADLVFKTENAIADLNQEIQETPEFFQDAHPEADEFIRLHTQE